MSISRGPVRPGSIRSSASWLPTKRSGAASIAASKLRYGTGSSRLRHNDRGTSFHSPENNAPSNPGIKQSNGVQAATLVALSRSFEDPVPSELAVEGVDLATLAFNYRDLGHLGVDRAAMNKAVFGALKSGGLYVIADHSGRPGTGISESGTLHRIEEAFLRQEVEAAGFKLIGEGNFLRNPNDPREKNTPDPPQPKDEFVLKFVKP
jgi:predicted methyltransferase